MEDYGAVRLVTACFEQRALMFIAHADFNFFLIPLVEMIYSMIGTDYLDGLSKLSKLMEIEILSLP